MINTTCSVDTDYNEPDPEATPPGVFCSQCPADAPPDVSTTLQERGKRYGSFTGHAEITVRLKSVIHEELNKRGKDLKEDQIEALHMIAHKIGRIINGDPDYADSWIDIAGYAVLVQKRLEGEIL
jgi:hypothetical protein